MFERQIFKITSSLSKLGTQAYYIVSMTTCTTTNIFRHFSLKLLTHLTVECMEIKLGMHVYYIVSMMTTWTKKIASYSHHKLVNGSTHGDETWYACVLHRFHDDNVNKTKELQVCIRIKPASFSFIIKWVETNRFKILQNRHIGMV